LDLFASFLLFVAVTTLSPGGATALATSSGMRHGVRGSLPLILGMMSGMVTITAASAFGLGNLFLAYPSFRLGLAALGTAYFLWLAWKIGGSGAPALDEDRAKPPIGFAAGVLLLWLNPKAWTMALGAAASFGGLADNPVRLALILSGTFAVCGTGSLILWAFGGAELARRLTSPFQWRVLNLVLAALLLVSILPVWADFL